MQERDDEEERGDEEEHWPRRREHVDVRNLQAARGAVRDHRRGELGPHRGAISLEVEALAADEEGTTPRRKPSTPAHAAAPPSTTARALGLAALVAASFAILSASAALRNSPRELGEPAPAPSTYVSSYEVVATMEHDPSAFTQGLAFDAHGRLFESDGLYHQSRVREVDPATGRSVRTATNSPSIFGEGVEVLATVIQITR